MVEQNQNQERERLPVMYKTGNLIGRKFRVLGGPYSVLKTDYAYYQKYGTGQLFREQNGQLQRYDKENKQWVFDDKNKYWYKDKYGKNRNHIQANSRFVIEFSEPTTVEVYMGGKYSKTVTRCVAELSGSEMFGQTKRMLDRLNEFEQMGHDRKSIYLTVEKNGMMYEFKFGGVVQNSEQSQNQAPQQSQEESVPKPPHMQQQENSAPQQSAPSDNSGYSQNVEDMITKLQEKGIKDKSKLKMYFSDKDLGLGLDEETTDKIIKERFNL